MNSIIEKIRRITGRNRLVKKEIKELTSFVNQLEKNKEVGEWLESNWQKHVIGEENIGEEVEKRLEVKNKNSIEYKIKVVSVVATILLLISFCGFYILRPTGSTITQKINKKKIENKRKETKSVVLESHDGNEYNLSEQKVEIRKGKISVVGNSKKLEIETSNKIIKEEVERIQKWNTLKVPRGKDYFVVLSDGTKIWMNASSELRFPNYFIGNKREVELQGEAYLEVKSNIKNPFIIKTPFSLVEVTGTNFNICSYKEDAKSQITLVEGKVNVKLNGSTYKISPGEQLIQDYNNIQIKEVEPYQYISWKDGVFEFNDMKLEDIAKRLEKWYDISFEFKKNSIKNLRFTGMTKKEYDLNYFIKILEKTTQLSFKRKQSRFIVGEEN